MAGKFKVWNKVHPKGSRIIVVVRSATVAWRTRSLSAEPCIQKGMFQYATWDGFFESSDFRSKPESDFRSESFCSAKTFFPNLKSESLKNPSLVVHIAKEL